MLRVHALHGLRRHQLFIIAINAVVHVHDHELRDVTGRRDHIARRPDLHPIQLDALEPAFVATLEIRHRDVGRERIGNAECRRLHPQRREDVLLNVSRELLPAHAFDHVPGQRVSMVRVSERPARRQHPWRHRLREVLTQRIDQRRQRRRQTQIAIVEPSRVGHDIGERHWLGVIRRDLELREIRVHVGVEIDLALLGQLHHRRRGDELGNRRNTKARAVRIDRQPRANVGESVTRLQRDLAVLDDEHHGARKLTGRHQARHEAVDIALEPRFRRRNGGRRCGRGPGSGNGNISADIDRRRLGDIAGRRLLTQRPALFARRRVEHGHCETLGQRLFVFRLRERRRERRDPHQAQ